MMQPKRTKFRKAFKGRIHGLAKGGTDLNFGAYGMKIVEPGRITARQIEAARRAITRHLKRVGMFEIDGVAEDLAAEAIRLGAAKLPVDTRFVRRVQQVEEAA